MNTGVYRLVLFLAMQKNMKELAGQATKKSWIT